MKFSSETFVLSSCYQVPWGQPSKDRIERGNGWAQAFKYSSAVCPVYLEFLWFLEMLSGLKSTPNQHIES